MWQKARIFVFTFALAQVLFLPLPSLTLAEARKKSNDLAEEVKRLKAAATKFMEAYTKRDYKTMYKMLDPAYRARVPFWEYKDAVEYPGITDGYIKGEISEVYVAKDGKYGRVLQKIYVFETRKEKTTGHITKYQDEKLEAQEWIKKNGVWYKKGTE